jgi:hypothetical protein
LAWIPVTGLCSSAVNVADAVAKKGRAAVRRTAPADGGFHRHAGAQWLCFRDELVLNEISIP